MSEADPLRDAPARPGTDTWSTGGLRVPWGGRHAAWWAALLNRVHVRCAHTAGGCLVFDSPQAVRDALDCEGRDLLTHAEHGQLSVASNRHYLRALPLPIRALPETA